MEDALHRIREAIATIEKELELDWRFSYSKLVSCGPGCAGIELSRRRVWRRLQDRLEGFLLVRRTADGNPVVRSADGVKIELKLLAPDRHQPLWVVSSVADVRREPSHTAELLTQLIMGEAAYPLKAEGDWFLVRLADDYHGWIRSWYVRRTESAEIASYAESARSVVRANVGYVLSDRDERSLPVSDVVAGTKLAASPPSGGFAPVTLPGGRRGFMREGDLDQAIRGRRPDGNRIVERAMRYLGIPYLWGGTTPKGFDCSGLVMRVYAMEGVSLPRDSDRQALVGALIPKERMHEAAPADLLFFGEGGKVGHVAMSLGESSFIHAYGEVRINSLLEAHERFDEKLARIFLFARSVLRSR
jgi:hypothetical protein